MKELTYLHCQSLSLSNIGNNFYCYLKKQAKTPIIFIILDCQKNKIDMIKQIETLHQDVGFMPIIVTDIKDQSLRDRLSSFSGGRIL